VKILAIEHATPERSLSNEWIGDELSRRSREFMSERDLGLMRRQVLEFLEGAGSEVRYQSQRPEEAVRLGLDVARRVMRASDTAPGAVDLVIYAGVGRGWLEPAMGHLFQGELGLVNASCFDVLDGCASWLRALQLARTYVRTEGCKRVLIINCECGFRRYGEWQIQRPADVAHYQATFTIGEASTAAIVSDDDPEDDYYFRFKSFGEYYDLCMIPLPNAEEFLTRPIGARHEVSKFYALSSELLKVGVVKVVELFHADPHLRSRQYDIAFGHEASAKASAIIARSLRIPAEKCFITHARYGNTVSASLPLGMSLAIQQDRLKRGDRVLLAVAGSGLSIGFASFTF
jgi:3-oxoacyl-[acyl-carrier-protein] synthase III